MTAVLRCFARGAIKTGAQDRSQLSNDSILIMSEPYIARESITADTGTPLTSGADLSANAGARLLQVQVQTGKTVHYRISANGDDTVAADTSDPIVAGDNLFQWGPAHFISFLEAS